MRAATILAGLAASTLTAAVLAQPMPVGVYLYDPAPGGFPIDAMRGISVSRDGMTVSGTSNGSLGYRWTLATGRVDLDASLGRVFGLATDGSATLHVQTPAGQRQRAVLHRPATGVQDLGVVSGIGIGSIEKLHASNNASTVYATRFTNPQQFGIIRVPYRWTQATGWQDITPAPFFGSDWIETVDVSDDGNTWLGLNNGFTGTPGYFTARGTTVTMLTAPAGFGSPSAAAINAAGTIAVGGVTFGPTVRTQPAIWTNGVPTVLPQVPGFDSSFFTDVSNDGSVAVGITQTFQPSVVHAFVWTSTGGMKTLADFLDDYGLALPSGVQVREIQISGDGTVLAGQWEGNVNTGLASRGFFAVIPAPSSVLIVSGLFAYAARRRR